MAAAIDTGADLERLLLVRDIEEFFYAEADLLDERRFVEWLDLFTDDVQYLMPMRRNVKFGEWERETTKSPEEVSWFDDNKTTLTQRVNQLLTGVHWAEEPRSRVCHVVSGVRIKEVTTQNGEVTAVDTGSRFVVYRNRLEMETDLFVGRREDTLRRVGGQWKIARRVILLEQNVLLAKNLTVFF